MVGIGSIISVGGGGGGGGGGGSGISSLNTQIGPSVTIVGVNGVAVTAAGNVITIDNAALSGLIGTGGSSTSSSSGCFVEQFSATTSGRFTHGLGTRNLLIQVLDDSEPPRAIAPDEVIYDTLDDFSILFNTPQAGTVLAVNCNGSSSGITSVNDQVGPNITIVGVNGAAVTAAGNVITIDNAALSGLIGTGGTGSGCFVESFAATTSGRFIHNFGTRNLLVQIVDDSGPPQAIVPDVVIYDTLNAFSVIFNSPQAGTVLAVNCDETLGGGTTTVSPRVELDLEFKSAFNSNTYSEITRVSGEITQIDIWETSLKANKLFTKAITRVSGEITQVLVTCDQTSSSLVTDITRVSGEISAITKTYTPTA